MTQHGSNPENDPELEHDAIWQGMIKDGLPLDRDSYIFQNWLGEKPDPWTYEHEMQLPKHLRQDIPEEG